MENIDKVFEEYLDDLKELVGVASVIDESATTTPFGDKIQEVLELALKQAKRLGFETFIDPKGYYGYAEIGSGEELFGVLGHLDVVPIGSLDKWNTDPFELVIKDGNAYGRGTQDDKGPTLLAMHALITLLKSGKKLNKRVRFIFGTDEENLWRCMDAYKLNEEMPSMGFTPDSMFPVIYAEKGLIQYNISSNNIIDFNFSGGDAFNAVPSLAQTEYSEKTEENLKKLNFNYKVEDNKIIVEGKAAHSASAYKGINAITNLAQGLSQDKKDSDLLRFIIEKGLSYYGEPIFGVVEDEPSGKLTFNIGIADFSQNKQYIGLDMRIPVTSNKDELDSQLRKVCLEYNLEIEEYDYLASIYVPRDTQLVKSLMKAYQEVTNDFESQPITSGGATYARAMSNCVAFGAILPTGMKTEHQPNEYVNIEEMKIALKIYMKAFEMLVCVE